MESGLFGILDLMDPGTDMAHRLNTMHGMCTATPAWAMYCTLLFSTGGLSLSNVSQDFPAQIPGSQVGG